ncbi:MAG: hypothetical protein RBT74_06640 [Tenuifilaceae bacterium]|nr:hypothetical protein [Tenuifilaceae bacterium]
MKRLIYTSILAILLAGTSIHAAQNSPEDFLGLPGDNLNLFAVMNLFQNSETLEAFERELNKPETMINNLDLNNDNRVDYIMVFDYQEDNVHSIVLRVALNQQEYQDVAVFTVQRFADGSVQIQLIGDEDLYGPNYIVEPVYAETPNPGYRGNYSSQSSKSYGETAVVTTTYYEVAEWPLVVYIYAPTYRPWRSSWYWGYYPSYWNPWTPHYWHYYYGYHSNWHVHYHTYYRPWRHHRCDRYHTYYYGRVRKHSPTVVVNVSSGRYKETYSRPDRKRDGHNYYTQRYPNGHPREVKGRPGNTNNSGQSVVSSPTSRDRVGRANSTVSSRPNRENKQNGNDNTQGYRSPRRINSENTGSNDRGRVSTRPSVQSSDSEVRTEKPASRPSSNPVTTRPSRENSGSSNRESTRPSDRQSNSGVSNRESSKPRAVESSKPSRSNERSTPKVESSSRKSESKSSGSSSKSSSSSERKSESTKKSEDNRSRNR